MAAAVDEKINFCELPIDLCCIVDQTSRTVLFANNAFENILGWPATEIVGKKLDEFMSTPIDIDKLEKAFSKLSRGVRLLNFEAAIRTKNNVARHVDWRGYIDEKKPQLYFIGRDITAYLEAQKTLVAEKQTDRLTGVQDRGTFLAILSKEIEGALRYHYPLSVILADIDHFGKYVDDFGVKKGDDCLKKIAIELKTCLRRKTDLLARFENDAFIVLLSHNELEKGIRSAGYIQQNLVAARSDVTLSFGVVGITGNEKVVSVESVITKLRQTLNAARRNGGNQVMFMSY